MAGCTTCNVCAAPGTLERSKERQQVPCNVLAFKHATFTVWRCIACRSLHCAEDADLASYYSAYPLHRADSNELNAVNRIWGNNQLSVLTRQGVKTSDRILDYGCGAGKFLRFLQRNGYTEASGYDPYVPAYADGRVLDERYDAIVTWDVVEHVEDPREFLRTLARLLRPEGLLVIGTPNADYISLRTSKPLEIPELHQPYHRHILSESALLQLGRENGLKPSLRLRRWWIDSPYPFINTHFIWGYMAMQGGYIDVLVDRQPPPRGFLFRTPSLLFKAFFGYFFPARRNMIVSFRSASPVPAR
jgi:SAM-dependent methyltransferase